MKIKLSAIALFILLFVWLGAVPALAGSRSATVRISCTVLPALEMTTGTDLKPALAINLQSTDRLIKDKNGYTRLYSVTAL